MADGDVRSGHRALVEFASPRGRRSLPRRLNLLYVGSLPPTGWIHHLCGEIAHRLAALGRPARARDGPTSQSRVAVSRSSIPYSDRLDRRPVANSPTTSVLAPDDTHSLR